MLRKLTVKNYAIIDHIEIDFSDHLNIITGETGAGKSILLGALALVLGQRADTGVLFEKEKKCVIEGAFDVSTYQLEDFFEQNDLDHEPQTIIRREIGKNGKSRAFINDTPVNLSILKELGNQLVNLHSQHETLALNNVAFQLQLVDAVAQHNPLLTKYQKAFKAYKTTESELHGLLEEIRTTTGNIDYLQYQLNELEEAQLNVAEQEAMEAELTTLENAEEIKGALQQAGEILSQSENAVLDSLNDLSSLLHGIKKYHTALPELLQRLDSSLIELNDIAKELEQVGDEVVYDPERIVQITERINEVFRLQKKHQVQSVQELLDIRDDLLEKIASVDAVRGKIEDLETSLAAQRKEVEKLAAELSAGRKKVIPSIEKKAIEMLAFVGMPGAQLEIKMESLPFEKVNLFGADKIIFLFSANKGQQPEDIRKVASGGELSRLMLVLKSLIASNMSLPTLIFDEIDTGISGEVAQKVGQVLQSLSKDHQVVCITHLPQIASRGQAHYFVYKETGKTKTVTRIRTLEKEERIQEIAKMLSGENITEAALNNAKELLLN